MGMGYVPQDPIYPHGEGSQFQRRQRGGTPVGRHPRSGQHVAASRLARARWAEQLAAKWYREQGFEILAMNWTMRGGELDVVARKENLVVICEVKARATDAFGSPLDAITPLKQQRVRRAGFAFLRTSQITGVHVRFDVAAVLGTQLHMHTDIF